MWKPFVFVIVAFAFAVFLAQPSSVFAAEEGVGHYIPGALADFGEPVRDFDAAFAVLLESAFRGEQLVLVDRSPRLCTDQSDADRRKHSPTGNRDQEAGTNGQRFNRTQPRANVDLEE